MKSLGLIPTVLIALSLAACGSPRMAAPHRPVTPLRDSVFTSTRSVTALLALKDGTLWVGTAGGLLRRSPDGNWRKWTRLDGLPSEEARRIMPDGVSVTAEFPRAAVRWQAGAWQIGPAPEPPVPPSAAQTCAPVLWRGANCAATLSGLEIGTGPAARTIPLPPSLGTHVSALLPHGDTLWAALYGDGLWEWSGERWRPLLPGLPAGAKEITALAARGSQVWIGTRRAGVWTYDGREWANASPLLDEPADHNIQFLTMYHSILYAGTLEDGLMERTPAGWHQVVSPTLSSDAPRQMAVFQDRLYVRLGNGMVDRFDGARWAKNVFSFLPRGRVSALASDGARLYLAEWGGWSECDGKVWTHHLALPALQGLVLTSLCPDGGTLWIGTQGRGLAQVNCAAQTVRWHDERTGLLDDWITCLLRVGAHLYAGTFVGGLACWDGVRWSAPPALAGQNVTALEGDGAGGVWIATRQGGWHRDAATKLTPLGRNAAFLETEQQALCVVPDGLWIGSRTGLDFLTDSKIEKRRGKTQKMLLNMLGLPPKTIGWNCNGTRSMAPALSTSLRTRPVATKRLVRDWPMPSPLCALAIR